MESFYRSQCSLAEDLELARLVLELAVLGFELVQQFEDAGHTVDESEQFEAAMHQLA